MISAGGLNGDGLNMTTRSADGRSGSSLLVTPGNSTPLGYSEAVTNTIEQSLDSVAIKGEEDRMKEVPTSKIAGKGPQEETKKKVGWKAARYFRSVCACFIGVSSVVATAIDMISESA